MYQKIDEMKQDLNKFLIFYNFKRRNGGLRKENRQKHKQRSTKHYTEFMFYAFK
jgi:hypothetical protein